LSQLSRAAALGWNSFRNILFGTQIVNSPPIGKFVAPILQIELQCGDPVPFLVPFITRRELDLTILDIKRRFVLRGAQIDYISQITSMRRCKLVP
jgi:hypothetical protein